MRKEDTVKLISAEGFEFVIDKSAALVSNTLKNMLTSSGSSSASASSS
jgi:transcription elongation factor B subunit 1